ncbi:GntR family transcriptional regulator [Achromobacter deleyi]|uniref:GntR family transcriptional regulator n=1 Tax=Achromobacter deleyi TaxID=1353891 RepID=UPI001F46E072|nr:GntR family transcriptional regulator [Achromobacter deleyi]UIP18620.1 GntR family transcriptional regulator [Achromobacter deleyi]
MSQNSPLSASPSHPAAAPASGRSAGRLVRKTAVDLVVDELRDRILSGAIPPGSALRQELFAEELGVSRLPVREAIRQLSAEGLIDMIPHRGAYVSMLSRTEVQEFFDIRMRLEPWLFRVAVHQKDDGDLDRAEQVVAQMDAAAPEQWGRLNCQLHELLYRSAQRPAALGMIRALHEKSERYFRFQIVNAPIRQQAHDEHMELIALARQGQPEKAEAALERHIAQAADQILAIVDHLLDASAVPQPA